MSRRNSRREDRRTHHDGRRDRSHDPAIRGPSGSEIGEALEKLADSQPKDTPALSALKTLQDAGIDFPVTVGRRRILGLEMAKGKPRHGAKRSDDHISYYEVEYCDECPTDNCHSETLVYKYSANHHIAGQEKTYCKTCQTVHESEEWY